jgi:hypothetical protein
MIGAHHGEPEPALLGPEPTAPGRAAPFGLRKSAWAGGPSRGSVTPLGTTKGLVRDPGPDKLLNLADF